MLYRQVKEQQQQQLQPLLQAHQPSRGAIAGGLLAPWADGAIRGQPLPALPDSNLQVAISAGLKATAKQVAYL